MATLFTKGSEEFDSHSGSLIGYTDTAGSPQTPRYHYDLRSFFGDDIIVSRTMNDMNYWNVTSFDGIQIAVLDAPRIVVGRSIAARQMTDVDGMTFEDLNLLTMADLSLYTLAAGNEGWPIGDANVTVGKDSTERWANSIAINLTAGVEKVVGSTFRDNILTDLNEPGHSYYIEMALPGLLAQGSTAGTAATFSGTEITDAVRTTGTEGDGKTAPDSTVGIWTTTTNLCTNGGFETNTTGWTTGGTNAFARDTTQHKFGTASAKATYNGNTTLADYAITVPAADDYFISAWVYIPAAYTGASVTIQFFNFALSVAGGTGIESANMALRDQWQRIVARASIVAGDLTGNVVITTSPPGAGQSIFIDGVQIERKKVATPYKHTDGSTATRAAAQPTLPVVDMTATKGWMAMLVKPGFPTTAVPKSPTGLFAWGTVFTDAIIAYIDSSAKVRVRRGSTAGGTVELLDAGIGWGAAPVLIILTWDATTINVSVASNQFQTATSTGIPNLSGVSTINLGNANLLAGGGTEFDGDFYWVVTGKGTLDQTHLSAIGTIVGSGVDPTFTTWPVGTQPTMIWTADTTATITPTGPELANSFVEFTSGDSTYPAALSDKIPLSASENSLTAGGNTYFRVNRNLLTNVNLSNVTGIRFRLNTRNNTTFKAQAMRVVRDDYAWQVVDIDTKRNQWRRSVPRDSGTEPAAPSSIYMTPTKFKNGTVVAKFNSGHLDAANANVLTIGGRKTPDGVDTRIRAIVSSLTTGTTLTIRQTIAGVDTNFNTSLAALSASTDYFLVLEFYENQMRASLYLANAAFLGTLVGTTGWQTTSVLNRGYTGFNLQPYNYDFYLDYVTMGDAEFARYESVSLNTMTPVLGTTLATRTSAPVDLGTGHYVPAGDATTTSDPLFGLPAPALLVARDGTGWQGGYMTDTFMYIGNPKYLTVSGSIFPVLAPGQSTLRGDYRVVLLDKNDSVGFIGMIRGLLPSQWNDFNIRVNSNLVAGNYRMLVQQTGFFNDQFYLDNLLFGHQSVTWQVSPNAGTDWYPFLQSIDGPYTGVNMIAKADKALKTRAIALSDTAWIANYELDPMYGVPGRKNVNRYDTGTYGSGTYGG